jgi:hypothetical protein
MKKLLEKLNYKGNKRIAVLNAEEKFLTDISTEIRDVIVDREIDSRFPYDFILVFARNRTDVETYSPVALHNLMCDGILWFFYPKKSSKKYHSDIDRDHGWQMLNEAGFHGIRLVSVDDNWSGMRFRSKKYIRSASGKFF